MVRSLPLRRSAGRENLRHATGPPLASKKEDAITVEALIGQICIPGKKACHCVATIADRDLIPAPLVIRKPRIPEHRQASTVLKKSDDAEPFPAFDDAFSADLLEPAVHFTFGEVDWATPSGHFSKGDEEEDHLVSPRTLPTASWLAHAVSLRTIETELSSDDAMPACRRNNPVVLQVSHEDEVSIGTEEETLYEDVMEPLLTLHGFPYDLRSAARDTLVQSRTSKRKALKAAIKRGLGWVKGRGQRMASRLGDL